MMWIPNAVHITTVDGEKHIFASFGARDRAYEVMSTVWKAVKQEAKLGDKETEGGPEKAAIKTENMSAAAEERNDGSGGEKGDQQSLEVTIISDDIATLEGGEAQIGESVSASLPSAIVSTSSDVLSSSTTTTTTTTLKTVESFSQLSDEERWSIVKTMYGDNMGFSQQEEIKMFGLKKVSSLVTSTESDSSTAQFSIGDHQKLLTVISQSGESTGTGSSEEDKGLILF